MILRHSECRATAPVPRALSTHLPLQKASPSSAGSLELFVEIINMNMKSHVPYASAQMISTLLWKYKTTSQIRIVPDYRQCAL